MRLRKFWAVAAMALAAAFATPAAAGPAEDRKEAMKTVAASMKVLSRIAKGRGVFDGAKAKAAAGEIDRVARSLPDLFKSSETNRSSESKPEIWTDWSGFIAEVEKLQAASRKMLDGADSAAGVASAMRDLGGTCRSCHGKYRL